MSDTCKTVFSKDRQYRYVLHREWDGKKPYVMFIGLNPSIADENENDQTLKRCIGFAKSWGYGGLCMTNLFAFVSTDRDVMKEADEPIGLDNDMWLLKTAGQVEKVVAVWGEDGTHLGRSSQVRELISNLYYIKLTKTGEPSHPLYLKGDLKFKKLNGGTPEYIEFAKVKIQRLVDLVNSLSPEKPVEFHQQDVKKKNMAVVGKTGRMYIQPTTTGYDVGLSGKALEESMYQSMKQLFGSECSGHKQTNVRIGKKDQPFWRVDDFDLVRKAVFKYVGLSITKTELTVYPDEVDDSISYPEGAISTKLVNKYERNAEARKKCIDHFGYVCSVCDINFEKVYGAIGKEFIHVHHLVPLSEIKSEYKIDPIKDLIPVCPNCHSMLHRRKPPFTPEEIKEVIELNQTKKS